MTDKNVRYQNIFVFFVEETHMQRLGKRSHRFNPICHWLDLAVEEWLSHEDIYIVYQFNDHVLRSSQNALHNASNLCQEI